MRGLLILLLLAIANSLSAANADIPTHRIRHFTNRQLAATTLTDFCKDDDGFMWIGTGTGLLRFDGANFDSFFYDDSNSHSLSDNRVNKLLYDSRSRLWVATCEGLNLYIPESDNFARVSLPGIEFNGYISDICECSDGAVAFVAAGIGVYKVSPSDSILSAEKIDLPEGINVNSIIESSSRRLICGTHDGKVVTINEDGSSKREKITDSYIRFLLPDSNGDVLVFSTGNILKWNEDQGLKGTIGTVDNTNPEFTTATLRHDGSIIAASEKHGLYLLNKNGDKLQPANELKITPNRHDTHISALYEDPDRNLWIGILRYGALMAAAEDPDLEYIAFNEIIENFHPGPIETITDGNTLWCGLSDGRLLNIDMSGKLLAMRRYSNSIKSLCRYKDGDILVGVDHKGLYKISPDLQREKLLFRPDGKFNGSSIACDSTGIIYFGLLGGGVIAIDPVTGSTEKLKFVDRLMWVASLFCDSKNYLWIGMYGSLIVYDINQKRLDYLSHIYPKFCKGVHNSIAEDSKGLVWSATSNGLFIINYPDYCDYRHLSVRDGLPDIYLSSIAFDDSGNAWIGTHDAVASINPSLHINEHKIGSSIDDFGFSSSIISHDKVIFSGNKGIVILHPSRLADAHVPRKPYISGLFIDGTRVTENSTGSDGKRYMPSPGKINLSHDNGNLTVRLAVDDFARSGSRTYLWCMPGMYDSWTQLPAGISSVTLPHLSPGKYSLMLKSKEYTLESEPLEVMIHVSAPWYLTLTAKIIYLLLIIAIPLLGWMYYREKKRQKIEQEKIKYIVNTTEEMWQPVMKGNDEKLIKRISEIVNVNLNDSSFNVEKLGEEVGMSRAHLNRKMKELFGISPSEFIRNARLKQACELLKNEDLDIAQVAFRVGFCTQAHFANSFKRFTGTSPSNYRGRQRLIRLLAKM